MFTIIDFISASHKFAVSKDKITEKKSVNKYYDSCKR